MAYYINAANSAYIIFTAEKVSGKEIQDDTLLKIICGEISSYINDDILFEEQSEGVKEIPEQMVQGAIIPMLVSRMVVGFQMITSVSEGGSSATIKPTYNNDLSSYKHVLNRYKRLGVVKYD